MLIADDSWSGAHADNSLENFLSQPVLLMRQASHADDIAWCLQAGGTLVKLSPLGGAGSQQALLAYSPPDFVLPVC